MVVTSAMSGVTNLLIDAAQKSAKGNANVAKGDDRHAAPKTQSK